MLNEFYAGLDNLGQDEARTWLSQEMKQHARDLDVKHDIVFLDGAFNEVTVKLSHRMRIFCEAVVHGIDPEEAARLTGGPDRKVLKDGRTRSNSGIGFCKVADPLSLLGADANAYLNHLLTEWIDSTLRTPAMARGELLQVCNGLMAGSITVKQAKAAFRRHRVQVEGARVRSESDGNGPTTR